MKYPKWNQLSMRSFHTCLGNCRRLGVATEYYDKCRNLWNFASQVPIDISLLQSNHDNLSEERMVQVFGQIPVRLLAKWLDFTVASLRIWGKATGLENGMMSMYFYV